MPFKVVQTIEHGKTVLAAVPALWEENNILYWPNNKTNLRTLLQDEFSTPIKEKWEKLHCIIKRQALKSIMEAEYEIDVMELVSDTKDDENPLKTTSRRKRRCGTMSDYNEKNQKPESTLMQKNGNFENVEWGSTIDTNKAFFGKILANQETIIAQQAKLQTSLDTLTSLLKNTSDQTSITNQNLEKKDDELSFKPIEYPNELDNFEQKLKDPKFFKTVVSHMSLICGKTGKSNGIDSCYMLIDYLLTREFVSRCSWTGQSKSTEQQKTPLKFYTNFRKCFFNIILLADKDFSEADCDSFFKRVLKNSLARKTHKYESKHKRRPTNLNYTKKSNNGSKEGGKKEQDEEGLEKNGLSEKETSNDKLELEKENNLENEQGEQYLEETELLIKKQR